MKDRLGDRMKSYYEQVPKTRLMRRTPVIIRIDGRAFHTYTRKFEKPFDETFEKAMRATMADLCREIQGCVLGYVQSDEISLLLIDYASLDSGAWFDYEVQKMCSVAASSATMHFNRNFAEAAYCGAKSKDPALFSAYALAIGGAMFDARCFNVPREEVTNYFLWRQADAERNSVQSLGHSLFRQKEVDGLSNPELIAKIESEKGIAWGSLPTPRKRGCCCVRGDDGSWAVDEDIPRFRDEGRSYVERFVNPDLEEERE